MRRPDCSCTPTPSTSGDHLADGYGIGCREEQAVVHADAPVRSASYSLNRMAPPRYHPRQRQADRVREHA
jgi:hypothetical protein